MKNNFVKVFILMCVIGLFGIQGKAYASSPKIIMAEAGYYHNIALKDDGTVWTWGRNIFGELGDNTPSNRNYPAQVSGLSGMIDVSAGAVHSSALKSDGTVWSWGLNVDGEFGNGTFGTTGTDATRCIPTKASGLTGIIDIVCGGGFTLALKNDGTIWAWGANNYGQLGDDTTINRNIPVKVKNTSNVTAIAAGGAHSFAITSDKKLWAWGHNIFGQLGDGTTTDRTAPVLIMSGVLSVGADDVHSAAVKNDGTAWSWGFDCDGRLGNGTIGNDTDYPYPMIGISNAKSVACGESNTIVLKNDGTVWVCGANSHGELGTGDRTKPNATCIQLSGISGAKSISGGDEYTLVLLPDGSVWGCGLNNEGQLGN